MATSKAKLPRLGLGFFEIGAPSFEARYPFLVGVKGKPCNMKPEIRLGGPNCSSQFFLVSRRIVPKRLDRIQPFAFS